jgi:hypothetical protein
MKNTITFLETNELDSWTRSSPNLAIRVNAAVAQKLFDFAAIQV